jgi:peptidoglycan/xylan/chitin deacetylase (PgdA/CDA1 family)
VIPARVGYLAQLRHKHALWRLCREQRAVVLTYDDGPGHVLTPRLLDVLGEHGGRATFFALGRRATTMPSLLDRIVAEGHEVGCHTYDHHNAWQVGAGEATRDVDDGYTALAPWMAADGPFRPPFGKLAPGTLAAVRARRVPVCLWTHDSGDTHAAQPDPETVIDAVVAGGGGVVLMHDFDRDPPEPERVERILALTAGLVDAAGRHGLSVRTAGELLHSSRQLPAPALG